MPSKYTNPATFPDGAVKLVAFVPPLPIASVADKPAAVKVFADSERRRSCAWCRHFIVNPFCQRCGLSNREVEATDVCARFSARPEKPADTPPDAPAAGDAARRLDALFEKPAPAAKPAARARKDKHA